MKKAKKAFLDPESPQGKVNKIISLQRQNDIIAMLLEGKKDKEIQLYLVNKYRLANHAVANNYIRQAREIIKNRTNYELNNLISLHIERYEDAYKGLYEIGAYSLAATALKAKEKLLGFHRAGFHMKVTQGQIQQLQIQNVTDEYNIDRLDKTKRERFIYLTEKLRIKKK